MTSFTPYKGIQDSLDFRIPRRGFRTFSVELGFPDLNRQWDSAGSLSCIPNSKAKDYGFLTWGDLLFDSTEIAWLTLPRVRSINCSRRSPGKGSVEGSVQFNYWAYIIRDKTLIQNNRLILRLSRLRNRLHQWTLLWACVVRGVRWREGGRSDFEPSENNAIVLERLPFLPKFWWKLSAK